MDLFPPTPPPALTFPPAAQPDIVRSAQKDEFYRKHIKDQTFDAVNKIFGPRLAMRLQRELELCADLAYFFLTTGLGSQTLGEEYCDIVQTRDARLPSWKVRAMLVVLHVLVPYAVERGFAKTVAASRNPPAFLKDNRFFTPERLKRLRKAAPRIKEAAGVAERLHLALFYIVGSFYDLSKRVLGIKYVFNRTTDLRRPNVFAVLALLMLTQFAIESARRVKESFIDEQPSETTAEDDGGSETDDSDVGDESGSVAASAKCTLCLGPRRSSTVTACGHVFCWTCITEWCSTKPECPLCRQPITMQSLTCLYQF